MPNHDVLDFYGYYNLEESQQLLWQLLKIAISGNRNQISKKEWANLISFYENLDDFLMQSYGEHCQNKLSRKSSKITQTSSI